VRGSFSVPVSSALNADGSTGGTSAGDAAAGRSRMAVVTGAAGVTLPGAAPFDAGSCAAIDA
jgi:hypothetical protein